MNLRQQEGMIIRDLESKTVIIKGCTFKDDAVEILCQLTREATNGSHVENCVSITTPEPKDWMNQSRFTCSSDTNPKEEHL